MRKRELISTLAALRRILTKTIPKKEKDIGLALYSLQEICDYMLFKKDQRKTKEQLGVNFSNVMRLCADSTRLARKKDLDTLLQALAFIKVRLFDIASDAKLAERKFDVMMHNIERLIPDDDAPSKA